MEEPNGKRSARGRVARLLEGVVFYALLSLVALTAVPYGTVEEWWEAAFQCAVLTLTALWLTEGMLSGRWLLGVHRLLIPPLLLLIFIVAQALPLGVKEMWGVQVWTTLSADAYETRLVAFRLLALLLVAAMLFRYTSGPRRLRALIFTVIATSLVSAVFGIVRQAVHVDKKGFVLPYLRPQLGYAQFINNNHFALLMEMAFGLLLGLLASAGTRRSRGRRDFLLLAALTPIWAALVLSNSRGGVFGMAGQLLFFSLLAGTVRSPYAKKGQRGVRRFAPRALLKLRRVALAAGLLFVVGGGTVWVGGDQLVRRVSNLRSEVSTEGVNEHRYPPRLQMWRATWEIFRDHPVVGVGFGGYWMAVNPYYDASGVSVPQQAHNDYLEILASGGAVAAILVTCFAGLFLRRARKCLRACEPFRRLACFGALVGLFGAALHSIVDFGLHITVNASVLVSLIVIATAHVRPDGDRSTDDEGAPRSSLSLQSGPRIRQAAALRPVLATVCLLACPLAMYLTARAGISRWYSTYVGRDNLLTSADEAVRLSPSDPAANFFLFDRLSSNTEKRDEAMTALKRALSHRPTDYSLWMFLGFAREQNGDAAGASDALRQAVRLAPFYAEPHLQLGVQLLHMGRREQAFEELVLAAQSEPDLLPEVIGMAWEEVKGDVNALFKLVRPETAAATAALARFLIEQGKTAEAAALLRQADGATAQERRSLVARFLSEKLFVEAYQVWSSGLVDTCTACVQEIAGIDDGGFEKGLYFEEAGFGWRVAKSMAGLSIFLDTRDPHRGSRCLLLNFKGDSPAGSLLVSKLVLVEANARYRLAFAARTRELRTNGPPTIEVLDADSGRQLTMPTSLPLGDNGWHDYTAEFSTGQATRAVLLTVRRQGCQSQPCLIYGRIWLDDFSLRKL